MDSSVLIDFPSKMSDSLVSSHDSLVSQGYQSDDALVNQETQVETSEISTLVYNSEFTLYEVFTKFVQPEWVKVFGPMKSAFDNIDSMIQGEIFYPMRDRLTYPFLLCNPSEVKVVILGQDPYPELLDVDLSNQILRSNQLFSDKMINGRLPRATGISFSAYKEDKIPPSLYKVYAELARSIPEFKKPNHGNLESWATQGVLMLNACMIYRPNNPKLEKTIWKTVIASILAALPEGTIYLLWGQDAQSLSTIIPKKSVTLNAGHPSPTNTSKNQFVGCGHFSQVNEILIKRGLQPISWNLP